MTSRPRTPNRRAIRSGWVTGHTYPLTRDEIDNRGPEFDRWLAAEHASQRGQALAEAESAQQLRDEQLAARLAAFGRDAVLAGDMTPSAARVLLAILKDTESTSG